MSVANRAAQGTGLSKAWCAHFAANQSNLDEIPWDDAYRLTPRERSIIEQSIQQFQLGENAEGRRLLARGRAYADATHDPLFPDALALFIKEEQRHSRHLLRFMQAQGISAVGKHWVDSAFRHIRVLAGLELELRVLVTAEIIAVPYYRALGGATASRLLRSISAAILADENEHLKFQKSMLSRLGAARTPGLRGLVWLAHRLFLIGTCSVVWIEHRGVFSAASYTFGKFLEEALAEMSRLELPSTAQVPLARMSGSPTAAPNS